MTVRLRYLFRRPLLAAGMIFVLAGAIIAFHDTAAAQGGERPLVVVVDLEGAISPVTSRYLSRALEDASGQDAELVILRIDTPGGQLDATRQMVRDILSSQTPVVSYVAPSGARAASAGTFITTAAGVAAMAPATNIGAASVISGGGEDLPETLERKVLEDTAALVRSIADRRDRNGDALEQTVREATAYSATEAVELGVVDFVAEDMDALLARLDGTAVLVADDARVVRTEGARVERMSPGFFDRVLGFLADPNLAFLFLSLGGLALVVELWTPGFGVGLTLGVVLLLLAFASLGNLPFSWAGVALIVVAVALFAAELSAPGASFFGAAGVVALVLGGVFLFGSYGTPNVYGPDVRVSPWVLGGMGAVGAAFAAWLFFEIRKASQPGYQMETSHELIIGRVGAVTSDLDPEGEVSVAGEFWTARQAEGHVGEVLKVGERVRVLEMDGLTLIVKPEEDEREADPADIGP
ncbi:MAG: NfeD family protein [Chloroflexota bacterium]